jgi:hypothetical protein
MAKIVLAVKPGLNVPPRSQASMHPMLDITSVILQRTAIAAGRKEGIAAAIT